MPFFAELGGDKPENPHEAFDRWREARRERRRLLAHDRAVAHGAEDAIASPTAKPNEGTPSN
jgi:hypothetical protein